MAVKQLCVFVVSFVLLIHFPVSREVSGALTLLVGHQAEHLASKKIE